MSWWDDIWTTQAKDYIYYELPPEKTKTGLLHTPLQGGAVYIRVFLKSFRIVDVREGWTKFYGAVHSFISVPKIGGGTSAFHTFTSPDELHNLDPKHLDRVITLNIPLFGPVPYVGGDLDFKVGLFSIKAADLSGPFLDVVSSIAKAAGYSYYISAAMPFVDTLKKGIDALTDTDQDSRLEIGLSTTYNTPTTGYYAVVRADKGQLDTSQLRVDNSEHLVDDASGQAISDFPYLVFTVETTTERSDWADIPDLKQAYADLTAVVNDDKSGQPEIQAAFTRFRRKVKSSVDLIPADTENLLSKVKQRIQDITGYAPSLTTKFAAGSRPKALLPALEMIDLYDERISF
jgi:hypothetical protein